MPKQFLLRTIVAIVVLAGIWAIANLDFSSGDPAIQGIVDEYDGIVLDEEADLELVILCLDTNIYHRKGCEEIDGLIREVVRKDADEKGTLPCPTCFELDW